MRLSIAAIFGLSLASACTMLGDSTSRVEGDDEAEEGDLDSDECKIEGSVIGQEGTILRLGSKTITFRDWVTKAGESNEYVGFSITVTGASSVGYVVKSGGERSHSTATTWMHPAGVDGQDKAPAISNVDFCENCEDGSCDGDDDGGGGDCPESGGCEGSGSGGVIL